MGNVRGLRTRLCMRVLDRTKKVLDLIHLDDGPGNPYQEETTSGDPAHGT